MFGTMIGTGPKFYAVPSTHCIHVLKILKWLDPFLCFRQQRVVVNGINSDWDPVLSGVPQGTFLGPVLVSLYVNDITTDYA